MPRGRPEGMMQVLIYGDFSVCACRSRVCESRGIKRTSREGESAAKARIEVVRCSAVRKLGKYFMDSVYVSSTKEED